MARRGFGYGGIIGASNVPSAAAAPGYWTVGQAARQIGGLVNGLLWPDGAGPDPNFSSVVFLCHFDTPVLTNKGTGGNVYVCGAPANTTGITAAQTKFAQSSLLVTGSSGSAQQAFAPATGTSYSMGSGDFTIEFWVYPNAVGTGCNALDFRTASNSACPLIGWGGPGSGVLQYFVSNANKIQSAGGALVAGSWQHVAVARTGTSTKMFLNGTQVGSTFTDSTNYTSNGFAIGNSNTNVSIGAASVDAYFAEVRITKGVCRYTTTFSPPTTRFPDY